TGSLSGFGWAGSLWASQVVWSGPPCPTTARSPWRQVPSGGVSTSGVWAPASAASWACAGNALRLLRPSKRGQEIPGGLRHDRHFAFEPDDLRLCAVCRGAAVRLRLGGQEGPGPGRARII